MAFDPFGDSESLLEQGKSLVKSAGDQAKKQAQNTTQSVKKQVSGTGNTQIAPTDQQASALSNQQKQEFVQDLYSPSKQQTPQQQPPQTQLTTVKQQMGFEKDQAKKETTVAGQLGLDSDASKTASITQQIGLASLHVPKTPEEMAKMNKARSELQQMHDATYYKPTFVEKPKIKEQVEKQEKNQKEQQEKQDRMQLAEQKKQEAPIALQQAKNKIEMPKGNAG